jgi:Undecaprenyl-phosphate glucose phosphotransferase
LFKRYQWLVGTLFRLADVSVIVAAWLAAYWLRFYFGPSPDDDVLPTFETYAALAPLAAALWVAVFDSMHVYESRRTVGFWDELQRILRAHGLSLLYFVALTYLIGHYKYSRLVMIYFAVTSALAIALSRRVIRSTLRKIRLHGYNLRHVLVIGDGPAAVKLISRFKRFPELGIRAAGVVTAAGSPTRFVCGRPVLGHFADLRNIIHRYGIDEVVIALRHEHQEYVARSLEMLKDETVAVRLVPDVYSYVTLGCEVEQIEGLPVVRLNDSPLVGGSALAKRVTDATLSLVGMIVLSPLLLLIAMLVKLTSRGSVLYRQERMGLDGRTFSMLKFRSMRADAEASTGPVWAQAQDDRRTWFGTVLRKTSLDELPQLWNVLVGDMSLVGPRPERPALIQKFRGEIPHYMLRHKVKSGITGWAQVNGWRGNTSLNRRIECDLFYIRNWSYSLDLKILTMTLWKGFISKNAY